MASRTLPKPDLRRMRSYLYRLPLATRILLSILLAFHLAQWFMPGLLQWGALIPMEISVGTLYRTNTFAFLHLSIWHLLVNVVALVPLLERFEAEQGTIVTMLLFTGPFGLLPALLYTAIERFVLQHNSSAVGGSIWVFLLLAVESIKMWRTNPFLQIGDYKIPTWTTPLITMIVVAVLIPHTSLLGHLCGAAIGYLWGLGYIKFLAPSEKILTWIEGKLNLLGRLPHYVSVDQKTYGRYGVLPSTGGGRQGSVGSGGRPTLSGINGITVGQSGSTQRVLP